MLNVLESQDDTPVCVLSDSRITIGQVQAGMAFRQLLESLPRSKIRRVTLVFCVPGHAVVQGSERADKLAGRGHL